MLVTLDEMTDSGSLARIGGLYKRTVDATKEQLNKDPKWLRWWSQTSPENSMVEETNFYTTRKPQRITVRVVQDSGRALAVVTQVLPPLLAEERRGEAPSAAVKATEHLLQALTAVRTKLKGPETPDLPNAYEAPPT